MRRSERVPAQSAAYVAEAASLNLLSLMNQHVAKATPQWSSCRTALSSRHMRAKCASWP